MKKLHNAISFILLTSALIISSLSAADEYSLDDVLDDCKTADTEHHPILEYQTTMALLRENKYEDAAYCFYRGQLRWRIHLSARPNIDPSGDPALFGSLNAVIGKIVNEWAFGDISFVVGTLDEILAWHAANDDDLTPKAEFPQAHQKQAAGMQTFRDSTVETADDIRKARSENGLENR